MAGQGNYVNIGGINANWGQGLSSSLSGLSKSLLAQASEAKDRERQNELDEESKRQFGLDYQRNLNKDRNDIRLAELDNKRLLAADVEKNRQFDLTRSDQNQQTKLLNDREKDKENERLATLERKRRWNEALYGANDPTVHTLEEYPEVQKTAYNRIEASMNNEKTATQNFMMNPTDANRKALFEASRARYSLTSLGEGDVNTKADNYVRDISDYLVDRDSTEGMDLDSLNGFVDNLYKDDYARFNKSVESGEALPLRERFNKFASGLSEEDRANLDIREALNTYQDITGVQSRSDMVASDASANDQAYNDAITQAKLYNEYYDNNKSTSKPSSGGSDAKNYTDMLEDDIGPSDNEARKNAYTALRQIPNVTADGAFAAILSMTDSNVFGTSFPNAASDLKAGDTLRERALKFSRNSNISFSGNGKKSDYAVVRGANTPLEELLVRAIKFDPSKSKPINNGGLYNRALIDEQVRKFNSNSDNFSVTNGVKGTTKDVAVTEKGKEELPSVGLARLKKELEAARIQQQANLRPNSPTRGDTTATFRRMEKIKKDMKEIKKDMKEFQKRGNRVRRITSDIENLTNLLALPTLKPDRVAMYKDTISELKKELSRYSDNK